MRAWFAILVLLGACSSHPQAVNRLACDSCHSSMYDDTTTPVHTTAGYPRTCSDCHGTVDWTCANDSHNGFNIKTGSHAGYDCNDCHTSLAPGMPSCKAPDTERRSTITCTGCHWHSEARTAPRHLGNGEFVYSPNSCLECHEGGGRD